MPNADFTPSFNPSDIDTNYGSTGGDITVPTFHELKPFRFWCQKALPLVYDDSLSYYELLCKVVDYLNNMMTDLTTATGSMTEFAQQFVTNQQFLNDMAEELGDNTEALQTYINERMEDFTTAYEELQDYVNDYFANLDVQNEINTKLDIMAQDGTLSTLLEPFTEDWLEEKTEQIDSDLANQNQTLANQNQTLATQNSRISVLEGRMDTFSSLPSGSTSGNAELVDIRTNFLGETFGQAGDAVRASDLLASGYSSIPFAGIGAVDGYNLFNVERYKGGKIALILNTSVTSLVPLNFTPNIAATNNADGTNRTLIWNDDATGLQESDITISDVFNDYQETVIHTYDSGYRLLVTFSIKENFNYNYLYVVSNYSISGAITPNFIVYGTNWSKTPVDPTLSISGDAADAKVTGDAISELNTNLANQNKYGANVTSLEFATLNNYLGIKLEKSGNGYRIYGTASNTVNLKILEYNQIAGERYSYKSNSSVPFTNAFYIYLYGVKGTDWIKTDYEWTADASKIIEFRLFVAVGTTVDFTIEPVILKNKSNTELEALINDYNDNFGQVIAYKPKYNMEYGSINMGTVPPSYGNSQSRVRTMENVTIRLAKNDVIVVSDSNIEFGVCWVNDEGVQSQSGWKKGSYTMTEDGITYLLFRYSPETAISNIEDITDKITIFRHNSIYGEYHKDITINKRRGFYIRSVNHRGYNRYAPENTIPAFKLSSYMGFDACETDVRFTSDNIPVLLHDVTINRTARNADGTEISGTVNIADITYEQALTYDFGIYKGGQFAGTKIPTFNEYMALCKKLGIEAYVEIKIEDGDHVKQLVDIARSYDMLKHTSWIAFSYTALTKVLEEDPTARIGLLGGVNMEVLNLLKTGQSNVFMNADRTLITAQNIAELIENNIPLELYTVNGIATANAVDPYVSGLSSDYYNFGYELYKYNMDDVLVD